MTRKNRPDGVSQPARHLRRPFVACVVIGLVMTANASESDIRKEREYSGRIVLFGARLAADPEVSTIQALNPATSELDAVLELRDGRIGGGRISPDRSRLAFSIRPAGTNRDQVCLLGPTGELRKLTLEGQVAAWSPEGDRIACFHPEAGGFRSFVVDVESGATDPLPIAATDVVDDWSPRTGILTVVAGHPDRTFGHPTKGTYPLRQIEFLNLRDGRRSPMTTDAGHDNIWSRFSGDGDKIVHYRRHPENVPRIFEFAVVRAGDGSDPRDVLRFGDLDEHRSVRPLGPPCWSPDGSCVAWGVTLRRWDEDDQLFDVVAVPTDGRSPRLMKLSRTGVTGWAGIDWR